jgi:hypothetical protein
VGGNTDLACPVHPRQVLAVSAAGCTPLQPRSHTLTCNTHATQHAHPPRFDDVTPGDTCPLDVELRWMTQVTSSVYATPVITDLYSDGRKDIVVPGFVHYMEVLQVRRRHVCAHV